jgi:two-component system, OmpR family, KDP operon response regulator KdpE
VAETILIVEDEPEFAALVELWMGRAGYRTVVAGTGTDALRRFYDEHPDLVILDVSLPGLDGWRIIERIREFSRIPILMVTARSSEADKIRGLKLGADDYITKPFGMKEVIARLRVAIRHRLQQQGERPIFQVGGLKVDLVRRIVMVHDQEVKLSPREYEILRVLVQHAGKVLTHRFIIHEVWGGVAEAQNLRVHIRQLRQKIEDDPEQPALIHTETGVGYRLQAPD